MERDCGREMERECGREMGDSEESEGGMGEQDEGRDERGGEGERREMKKEGTEINVMCNSQQDFMLTNRG